MDSWLLKKLNYTSWSSLEARRPLTASKHPCASLIRGWSSLHLCVDGRDPRRHFFGQDHKATSVIDRWFGNVGTERLTSEARGPCKWPNHAFDMRATNANWPCVLVDLHGELAVEWEQCLLAREQLLGVCSLKRERLGIRYGIAERRSRVDWFLIGMRGSEARR